jgi:hypothetical protein
MPSEVMLTPPAHLLPYWNEIVEGWEAWFANKEPAHNPYGVDSDAYKAWKWGYMEGMDYGN